MTVEYLLEKEVDRVLAILMPSNRLVMRVVLHTGLRISDVLNLKTAQLAPRFWIKEQKTGKKRMIGLPASLLNDIKEEAGDIWAFPGRNPKKHRSRQAVWYDMKRAAAAFRLPQNVGTHSLRKVYAVELRKKYGNIDRVRRALNHSSDAVTLIYAMADIAYSEKYKKPRHGA